MRGLFECGGLGEWKSISFTSPDVGFSGKTNQTVKDVKNTKDDFETKTPGAVEGVLKIYLNPAKDQLNIILPAERVIKCNNL